MHTFFLLLALLLAGLAAGCGALLLRLLPPGGRRALALGVLAMPPVILAFATYHVLPLFWAVCSPLVGWDRAATLGLLAVMAAAGVGALIVNGARLVLIERLLAACQPLPAGALPRLPACAGGPGTAGIRLLHADEPLAVAGGLRRPAVVLSSWLVDHLDSDELAAVVTHELVHLRRRDYVLRWAARLVRDATIYLPSAWYALAVIEMDEELHADAVAVSSTGRPLAMASALGKVWAAALRRTAPVAVAGLPSHGGSSPALLEQRLRRLLDEPVAQRCAGPVRWLAGLGMLLVGSLVPRLLLAGAAILPLVCARPF